MRMKGRKREEIKAGRWKRRSDGGEVRRVSLGGNGGGQRGARCIR